MFVIRFLHTTHTTYLPYVDFLTNLKYCILQKRLKDTFLEHTKPTKGKGDYTLNPTGIYEKFLDFRTTKVPPKTTNRPIPIRRLWSDPDFNPEIVTNNHIEWIRPKVSSMNICHAYDVLLGPQDTMIKERSKKSEGTKMQI